MPGLPNWRMAVVQVGRVEVGMPRAECRRGVARQMPTAWYGQDEIAQSQRGNLQSSKAFTSTDFHQQAENTNAAV